MIKKKLKNTVLELKEHYPDKFTTEDKLFSHIHRGDRIFIGTGCGEPQYLVRALINYVEKNPRAFFDTEVFQVWTLGVVPYKDEKYQYYFRYNSFFVDSNIRNAVNSGVADYTPIFLSQVPDLFYRGLIPVNVALIQTSLPDEHGNVSLGISVDIAKAAVEKATLVIAQVNSNMPWTLGDGIVNIEDIDFIIPYDEPLLENGAKVSNKITQRIGKYVARIIEDGDTIQVGYGNLPNAILSQLNTKKHIGVHTELLSDGIVELMKKGVIDNSQKTIDRGKTVASFSMGTKKTYDYLHNNPNIEFRTIDYTNNPLTIARQKNMTAINSALEIDLTGQATAESIGKKFYSGIGGQTDFMRGALLSKHGKTILTIPSTARNGTVSRIVPFLKQGSGVTLNRGDIHYVVTEYGIAYLHGKNIRERAMELIAIAHPKFRPWLVQEAKKLNLIYKDQAIIPGENGKYPENLEIHRTTRSGLELFIRPVKINDEPLLKDFFYSLSDKSLHRRFHSGRQYMPHELLQKFVVIDYTKSMTILSVIKNGEKQEIVGVGQYVIDKDKHTAEVALVVRDDYQNNGIGRELLFYLAFIAKKRGILSFTAYVQMDNKAILQLIQKVGTVTERKRDYQVLVLTIDLRGT